MKWQKTIMKHPTMPMHGPEHHAMIAGVLVTAYKNLTRKATDEDIKEAIRRGAHSSWRLLRPLRGGRGCNSNGDRSFKRY